MPRGCPGGRWAVLELTGTLFITEIKAHQDFQLMLQVQRPRHTSKLVLQRIVCRNKLPDPSTQVDLLGQQSIPHTTPAETTAFQ